MRSIKSVWRMHINYVNIGITAHFKTACIGCRCWWIKGLSVEHRVCACGSRLMTCVRVINCMYPWCFMRHSWMVGRMTDTWLYASLCEAGVMHTRTHDWYLILCITHCMHHSLYASLLLHTVHHQWCILRVTHHSLYSIYISTYISLKYVILITLPYAT